MNYPKILNSYSAGLPPVTLQRTLSRQDQQPGCGLHSSGERPDSQLRGTWQWGLLLLWLLSTGLCLPALGQSYSLDWYTIDGGGGTSTGGVYAVSGTIGQPDASSTPMSGGNYSVTGGFWPGLVVPSTTGAPTLFIRVSAGGVVISWSPATPGFVLEETTSLLSPSWSSGPTGNPTAPIPATGETKFYRLRQQ